ncbi:MAG: hypothetical protein QOI61_291, partial [Actinomycetota bacterium]
CAAHSHDNGRRWWNHRTPERYIEAISAGGRAESGAEDLDDVVREEEALQLLLRTRQGVPAAALDEEDPDLAGLLVRRDDRLMLTVAGRLLTNEVAMRLQLSARKP